MKKLLLLLLCLPLLSLAQKTYVPDDNFELALIALGHDSGPLDDSVLTSNINTITILDVSNTASPIHEMTGIEDFTALVRLYCNNNHIDEFNTTSSMDLSGLTNLTHLRCQWNFLYWYHNKLVLGSDF